jgi:dynein heavy chain
LNGEIPDYIVVSMFKICSKVIRNNLADKHTKISEQEIELIAKRAKRQANDLIDIFEKMDMKIGSQPKDIEELTSIRDYMAAVPTELEKLATDIKLCMGVYDILNYFGYKFNEEDDFDKKWRVYGAPVETLKKIN